MISFKLVPREFVPLMPVLDAIGDGILIVDASGIVVALNKAMRGFYTGAEMPFPGYLLSEFNEAEWVESRRVLASKSPSVGKTMLLPAATVFARRMPIIQDGLAVGVLCVMQDISTLDCAAKKLGAYQRLETMFDNLLQSIPHGLLIADSACRIASGNSAICQLCGKEDGNIEGRNVSDLEKYFPGLTKIVQSCVGRSRSISILRCQNGNELLVSAVHGPGVDKRDSMSVINFIDPEKFEGLLQEAKGSGETGRSDRNSHDPLDEAIRKSGMVANSPVMRKEIKLALKVSRTDSSILLQGESGVGKSMLASMIHQFSQRGQGPFVSINCGAIPEQLMESELFGYERGAFTGANPKGKTGLLDAANNGTIFFDEIGELKLPMQVKLLEMLDKHAFLRVGGSKMINVNVRIIAATNLDLEKEVKAGNFRQDLFYRLNVIPIHIPPLRERKEDISAMALMILENYNKRNSRKIRLSRNVLDILLEHPFPGNARELRNIMEWMLVMAEGDVLRPEDLPTALRPHKPETISENNPEPNPLSAGSIEETHTFKTIALMSVGSKPLKDILFETEGECLRAALKKSCGMNAAAKMLGMHPVTLWRKLVQHGIKQADVQ